MCHGPPPLPMVASADAAAAADLPLQRVGIVGAGQLAQMLAAAARQLGLQLTVQSTRGDDPAAGEAHGWVSGDLGSPEAVETLARCSDVIGFENELVDLAALGPLAVNGVQFRPALDALAQVIDKRRQRHLLAALQIQTPAWVDLREVLTDEQRLEPVGYPLMAKAAHGGYDGRGLKLVRNRSELETLAADVNPDDWYLERLVPFERELAIIAARSRSGEVRCYPLLETRQHLQVCVTVHTPVDVPQCVEARARTIVSSVLEQLGYVGVLAVELFLAPEGLLVNELAPRTHNSGHLTIEACETSQFEQQLRAITARPLGSTSLRTDARGALMVNLLGYETSCSNYTAQREQLAALPGCHLHWYGKRNSLPRRKLGHVTCLLRGTTAADRNEEITEQLGAVNRIWPLGI